VISLPDLFEALRDHFTTHGYWTLGATLLLENAGIPLPGETMLLFASFLAFQHHELNLGLIIGVGTLACTLGDNLGYWIGHHGGRPLLHRYQRVFRVSDEKIARGEKLFERFGAVTVFFARFVFGMRVIAGPLAGVLRMPWRRFVLFNFLGAAVWVTVISCVGYFFGRHWQRLLEIVGRANVVVFVVAVVVVWLLWRRYQKREQK
jgi:membrane protein DedA with SNARE-associated domain